MEAPIPQVSPPPKIFTRKHLLLLIVLVVISLLGIVSSAALFMNFKSEKARVNDTEASLESLRGENNELEKELIFYKNTDLGKELEIVNLKLDQSEAAQTKAEDSLNSLRVKVDKIPSYANIISLMTETAGKQPPECYSVADKQKIAGELQKLGDENWEGLWSQFIDNTVSSNCSNSPDLLFKAVDYGLTKIIENTK